MFIEGTHIKTKGVDFQLIICYVVLVIIGWLTIFSVTYSPDSALPTFSLKNEYVKQLLFIGISIIVIIVLMLINFREYMFFAYFIYGISLILMFLTIFIGKEVNGAKAWIELGHFSIQPSEFAKLGTALALAKFFNEGKTTLERKNIWLYAFGIILVPIIIALLQKDTGSALLFFSFILLFYREGLTAWILIVGVLAVALFIFTLYFNELYAIALLTVILVIFCLINKKEKKKLRRNIIVFLGSLIFVCCVNLTYNYAFQPHQKMRIDTLLGKVSDPKGADFNVNQSMIAIGSGGFFGKGYMNGTQTKLEYVPASDTDFIFCAIGEEWGFVGSLAIIGLYIFLIIRILILSERQRNPFVRSYGYAIAGIIFIHFFVNIGMTIGILPIIGIPLPLISYGGSSFICFTTMIFIFLRLNDN